MTAISMIITGIIGFVVGCVLTLYVMTKDDKDLPNEDNFNSVFEDISERE